eukprot:CAMPEP_0168519314 /NCGR_PEP_ID=MMETSP0405-20121227/7242_1 /TAXON_ID=498012 /ORGANISM="Trichosphaerium sp, Strain Am-I-7 wt" /LENGTH=81 /DNA_ID=CAMNT_0008539829 /DNA_START=455 /DNA_END=696 /DNA_ORIENTATION=+
MTCPNTQFRLHPKIAIVIILAELFGGLVFCCGVVVAIILIVRRYLKKKKEATIGTAIPLENVESEDDEVELMQSINGDIEG